MFGFLIGEAFRDLRRAGRVAVSAVILIALSLAALGGFWVLSSNVGRAVAEWRDRVRVIVYLKGEPPAAEAQTLVERTQALPGVASVRYISKADALATLKQTLGKEASVADQLPTNPLPASLEVTPSATAATPEGARFLVTSLSSLPEAEEVAGSMDWVDRLTQWQQLLATIGLGVGAVLGLAAVLTVTTATTLVLHARRGETEIMRLVGAPEIVIRLPLFLQGMIQGLLGAVCALALLVGSYHFFAPRLEPAIAITLGLPSVDFLSSTAIATLVLTGAVLGGAGGYLARGRTER
ncbi:MAG: cell division protein FtsX [Candidatus Rokuibacteriota bacterium]